MRGGLEGGGLRDPVDPSARTDAPIAFIVLISAGSNSGKPILLFSLAPPASLFPTPNMPTPFNMPKSIRFALLLANEILGQKFWFLFQ